MFDAPVTGHNCSLALLGAYTLLEADADGTWRGLSLGCNGKCADCQLMDVTVAPNVCVEGNGLAARQSPTLVDCLGAIPSLTVDSPAVRSQVGLGRTTSDAYTAASGDVLIDRLTTAAPCPTTPPHQADVTNHILMLVKGAVDGRCRPADSEDPNSFWRAEYVSTSGTWVLNSSCTAGCDVCAASGVSALTWPCFNLTDGSTVVLREAAAFQKCMPSSSDRSLNRTGLAVGLSFFIVIVAAAIYLVRRHYHGTFMSAIRRKCRELGSHNSGKQRLVAQVRLTARSALQLLPTWSGSWDPREAGFWLITGGVVILAVVWRVHGPSAGFRVDLSHILSHIGLPADVVDPSREQAFFTKWNVAGFVTLMILTFAMVYVVINRKIPAVLWRGKEHQDLELCRDQSLPWRTRFSLAVATVAVATLLLVLPPLTTSLGSAFTVRQSNESFLTSDALARGDVEAVVGYGAMALFVSFMANVLLLSVLAILPGVYLACCAVVITCLCRSMAVGGELADQTFRHVRLTLCVFLFVAPGASCVHMLVVHQSLMLPAGALVAWFVGTLSPFLFFVHLRSSADKACALCCGNAGYNVQHIQRDVLCNAAAFAIVSITTSVALLHAVDFTHTIDVIFPALLWVATLTSVCGLAFITLLPAEASEAISAADVGVEASTAVHQPLLAHSVAQQGYGALSINGGNEAMTEVGPPAATICQTITGVVITCGGLTKRSLVSFRDRGLLCQHRRVAVDIRKHLASLRSLLLEEQREWHVYGRRLPYRRVWLCVGLIAYTYILFSQRHYLQTITVKEEVDDAFRDMGYDVSWPAGSSGTSFDCIFAEYRSACWKAWGMLCAAFCFLLVSFGTSLQKGMLKWSRWTGYVSSGLTFCAAVWPSAVIYTKECDLTDIYPTGCAPEVDAAATKAFGGILGMIVAGVFTFKLLAMSLAIVPAFVLAARLMLIEHETNFHVRASMVTVVRFVPLLTPLFTALPLMVVCQWVGDSFIGFLVTVLWIAPPSVTFFMTFDRRNVIYIAFNLLYFCSILALILYVALTHGLRHFLASAFESPDIYFQMVAGLTLANVVISDVLYSNLFLL